MGIVSPCSRFHLPLPPSTHPSTPTSRVTSSSCICFFLFFLPPRPVPPICCILACRRNARVQSACCAFCVPGFVMRAGHPSPRNASIRFVLARMRSTHPATFSSFLKFDQKLAHELDLRIGEETAEKIWWRRYERGTEDFGRKFVCEIS